MDEWGEVLVFEDRAKQRGRDPRHPGADGLVVEDDVCGGVSRTGYECAGEGMALHRSFSSLGSI